MGATSSAEVDPAILQQIDKEVAENNVMVYSKSYCPYCDETKSILRSNGVAYKAVELDRVSGGSKIQSALLQKTGQRTVPSIFINNEHVGGNSDLQSLAAKGKLTPLVKAGLQACTLR